MRLESAIHEQPEHSSVVYERGGVMLQRTLLVEEAALEAAFESIPWASLVFLRCDRQKGGKRALLYRWRAEKQGWSQAT